MPFFPKQKTQMVTGSSKRQFKKEDCDFQQEPVLSTTSHFPAPGMGPDNSTGEEPEILQLQAQPAPATVRDQLPRNTDRPSRHA